jgi:hypothetical protein
VTPHPGNVVSSTQAEALVQAAEARSGVRPLRRTILLAERIDQQREELQKAEKRLHSRQERYQEVLRELKEAAEEWRLWRAEVACLAENYQATGRPAGPYSRLAKARQKVGVRRRRLRRRARFVEENRTNRAPIRAIIRLDGGFGSGENLALLMEMGYEIYSKALSHQVTRAMRRRLTAQNRWTGVGGNAEMVAWEDLQLEFCPYPLDVGLERFYTGHKERYAVLLHYGEEKATEDLPAWFAFYNGRQTIEAGVKEGKHVFQMHHLKVRSSAGLAIQEEFAVLAANLVRWAAVWLHEQCPKAQTPFDRAQVSVKRLVRVAANTSAWVFWQPEGHLLLRFDELSPFTGVELMIGQGGAFQLPLPLFRNDYFGPI